MTDVRRNTAKNTVVVYETWTEFADKAIDGESEMRLSDRASREPGSHWAGCEWDEAVTLAREGWQEHVKSTLVTAGNVAAAVVAEREDRGFVMQHDVSGEILDVGRYTEGIPECVIEPILTAEVRRGRVVPLMVSVAASAGIDEQVMRRRGAAIVALAAVLRSSGFVLDVWASQPIHAGLNRYTTLVHVQDAAQPVDSGRLMFALAHPGMLRRLVFSVEEQASAGVRRRFGFKRGGGYGMPGEVKIDDFKKVPRIRIDNAVLLPTIQYHDSWDEETSAEWIKATVAAIQAGEPVPQPPRR